MMRAVASVPPPAPHGTISCTGRCGYWACAAVAARSKSAASTFVLASARLWTLATVLPSRGGGRQNSARPSTELNPFLLVAKELETTRDFYQKVLGVEIATERP